MGGRHEVIVVDAIMGSGKTSAAINYMESHHDEYRFLFVTPYLEEAARIKNACPKCRFLTPERYGTKLNSLKHLLKNGHNIVTTHALFMRLDSESLASIRERKYVLIVDEAMETIQTFRISNDDLNLLIDNGSLALCDDGSVRWIGDANYTGRFGRMKNAASDNNLIWIKDSDGNCAGIFQTVDPVFFRCFDKIIVLTYLFEGTKMKAYFDLLGFSFRNIGVHQTGFGYEFCASPQATNLKGLHDKITIWIDKECNAGSNPRSLSYSWYKARGIKNKYIKELKKSMLRFFRSESGRRPSASDVLWTTFNGSKRKLVGPGYASGFEIHNVKATNKHRNRTIVAYMVNKFLNPGLNDFFLAHGIEINQDMYALASMLQFIWRSAIRNGNHISVYIPSNRMRSIFEEWLIHVSGVDDKNSIDIVQGIGSAREKVVLLTGMALKRANNMTHGAP